MGDLATQTRSSAAAFPVDWQNTGNGSTHQLPADLTNLCENLVVRIYKRKLRDGKASENITSM
ncbi:MAG TPA: hypothetical protein VME68_08545 [Acidobacteriaceae bacterium]|nr:hypothetical protein [Acidobacteriaceae bacterium]